MTTPPKSSEAFEADPLWPLLGQAGPPAVPRAFAPRVVAAVRPRRSAPRWGAAWAVGLAAVLLLCATLQFPGAAPSRGTSLTGWQPGDTEVLRHLDELLAHEENALWLGSPSL